MSRLSEFRDLFKSAATTVVPAGRVFRSPRTASGVPRVYLERVSASSLGGRLEFTGYVVAMPQSHLDAAVSERAADQLVDGLCQAFTGAGFRIDAIYPVAEHAQGDDGVPEHGWQLQVARSMPPYFP